jgi:hypothetical protein
MDCFLKPKNMPSWVRIGGSCVTNWSYVARFLNLESLTVLKFLFFLGFCENLGSFFGQEKFLRTSQFKNYSTFKLPTKSSLKQGTTHIFISKNVWHQIEKFASADLNSLLTHYSYVISKRQLNLPNCQLSNELHMSR